MLAALRARAAGLAVPTLAVPLARAAGLAVSILTVPLARVAVPLARAAGRHGELLDGTRSFGYRITIEAYLSGVSTSKRPPSSS